MHLKVWLVYALIGSVQAAGTAGGLDCFYGRKKVRTTLPETPTPYTAPCYKIT